jgi:hypothetical protein
VHNPTCRCRECFGLAEYMLKLTGKTYGLTPTRSEAPTRAVEPTGPCDVCDHPHCQAQRLRERQKYQQAKRLPWELAA